MQSFCIGNMIVWVDGAMSWKTHVAEALAEQLANINAKYMGSDCYLYYFIQADLPAAFKKFLLHWIKCLFSQRCAGREIASGHNIRRRINVYRLSRFHGILGAEYDMSCCCISRSYLRRVKMGTTINTNVYGLHALGDSSGWTQGLAIVSAMGVVMNRELHKI